MALVRQFQPPLDHCHIYIFEREGIFNSSLRSKSFSFFFFFLPSDSHTLHAILSTPYSPRWTSCVKAFGSKQLVGIKIGKDETIEK